MKHVLSTDVRYSCQEIGSENGPKGWACTNSHIHQHQSFYIVDMETLWCTIPNVEPRDDLAVRVYNTRKKAQDKHRKGGFVPRTIARLRCMELQGLGRPIPFTRSFVLRMQ